jgi:hypothetical protein
VIDGGDIFAEAAPQRPFERVAISLPETEIPRIAIPEKIRQMAKKFGDIAWGKFRDIPFKPSAEDRAYLDEFVLPNVTLPRATRERIATAYASDTMTVGDMDTIRRSLGAQAERGGAAKVGNTDYRDLKNDVMAMMGEAVPETTEAVRRFAGLMQAAEGAEIGITAASPGTGLIKFVSDMMKAKSSMLRGVPPGARASIIEQGLGNPSEAYTLARELESNTGFAKRFEAAVAAPEARDLAEYAIQQKRGIDAIAALARVPEEKVESALKTAGGMVDLVAGAAFNVGGAFKATLVRRILERAQIGKAPAERLADMLLKPEMRDQAMKAIANLPLTEGGRVNKGLQGFIRAAFSDAARFAARDATLAASQIGKDNARMPEGYVGVEQREQ